MSYGEIKIDTITFTAGGVDTSIAVSGLVQNPTFTGNITTTGTISGDVIRGVTVSGATVTGTTGEFGTITGNTAGFTTVTGTTVTGTTANFVTLSGTTVTGNTGQFANITGVNIVGTTEISGATVTGNVGLFTTITGGIHTLTSGVFASGTVANPSITFVDDFNTGIYSPGADEVAISTNGTGRLFVDASGNVGVGAAPGTALEVKTTTPVIRSTHSSTGNYLQLFHNGSGAYLDYSANDLIIRSASSTERLRLTSTGALNFVGAGTAGSTQAVSFNGSAPVNSLVIDSTGKVGIGTSSPGATLHVNGGSASRTGYFVSTDTSAYSPTSYSQYHRLYLQGGSATNAYNGIGFTNGSNSEAFIGFVQNASGYGDFVIQSYAGSYGEKLRVTSAGNVGIGTTSPGALLDLAGGAIRLNSTHGIYKANADGYSYFSGGTGLTAGGTIFCFGESHSSNANEIQFRNSSNTTRAVIDSSGRVGIGTTSPSKTLHVYSSSFTYPARIETNGTGSGIELKDGTTGANPPSVGAIGDSFYVTTNNSERFRCDSSGRLLVGTSSAPLYGSLQVYPSNANVATFVADSGYVPVFCWNKTTGNGTFAEFGTGASYTIRGSITYNSGTGQTSYNVVSDYRAKTIIGKLDDSGQTIDNLNVYLGVMKDATQPRPMLVAHEAQEVAPYCVTGEKDAVDDEGNPVYQQMDHQVLVPLLIAEIQQLRARVAALESA